MATSRENNHRIEWVDTAKGIGIILVIVAHTPLDNTWVGKFINSFHMPLFFFLSGYFFSFDKFPSFPVLIKHRSKTLLIPYIVFASLSYLFFLLRYFYGDPDYFKDLSVYHQLFGIFYSAGTREWMDFNLPLWFLTCLFVVELMFYAISKVFRKKSHMALVLLTCSVIGYLDGIYNSIKLPWGIDVAFTAVVFYGLGHLLKAPCNWLLSKPVITRILFTCACCSITIVFLHTRVNLNMKQHGDYYDFYIAAIAGMTACFLLSSLASSKILMYLGKNALILMALHIPTLTVVTKLTSYFGLVLNSDAGDIIKVFITILVLVPIIYFINQYTPFILGKNLRHARQRGGSLSVGHSTGYDSHSRI